MKIKTILTVGCLIALYGCSSEDHVIQTEQEAKVFTQTFKDYMQKNMTASINKEEGCKIMEKASAKALASINSNFSAMNGWVEGYKDPLMALTSNTIPAQVFGVISGGLKDCEPFLDDNEAKKMVKTLITVNSSNQ